MLMSASSIHSASVDERTASQTFSLAAVSAWMSFPNFGGFAHFVTVRLVRITLRSEERWSLMCRAPSPVLAAAIQIGCLASLMANANQASLAPNGTASQLTLVAWVFPLCKQPLVFTACVSSVMAQYSAENVSVLLSCHAMLPGVHMEFVVTFNKRSAVKRWHQWASLMALLCVLCWVTYTKKSQSVLCFSCYIGGDEWRRLKAFQMISPRSNDINDGYLVAPIWLKLDIYYLHYAD